VTTDYKRQGAVSLLTVITIQASAGRQPPLNIIEATRDAKRTGQCPGFLAGSISDILTAPR
jgi:hypothetical protein